MDSSRKYNNPSPEVRASFVSKLFFCWILPFFKYGYSHDLETKDLYNAAKPDLSEPLGNILERNWNKELAKAKNYKTKPSLSKAICRTFYKQYMVYGAALFVQGVILRMIHPLILAEFINYFDKSSTYSKLDGWLLGTGVLLVAFANCLIMHQTFLGSQRIGMRCRVACCSLLYRKVVNKSLV